MKVNMHVELNEQFHTALDAFDHSASSPFGCGKLEFPERQSHEQMWIHLLQVRFSKGLTRF